MDALHIYIYNWTIEGCSNIYVGTVPVSIHVYFTCTETSMNYNDPLCDVTGTVISKGNHPQMALLQLCSG